jgi:hypothetical protein
MLEKAPRPFVVYALPPDSPFGVPINDKYGLVNTMDDNFWTEPRRARKFKEYDRHFRNFTCTEEVVPGASLTYEDLCEMGGTHFDTCYIDSREVDGFIDYIRTLDVLILRVMDAEGVLVLVDVSILLPGYNQIYGSFCQWNRAYKNRSPGMYACLLACRNKGFGNGGAQLDLLDRHWPAAATQIIPAPLIPFQLFEIGQHIVP